MCARVCVVSAVRASAPGHSPKVTSQKTSKQANKNTFFPCCSHVAGHCCCVAGVSCVFAFPVAGGQGPRTKKKEAEGDADRGSRCESCHFLFAFDLVLAAPLFHFASSSNKDAATHRQSLSDPLWVWVWVWVCPPTPL